MWYEVLVAVLVAIGFTAVWVSIMVRAAKLLPKLKYFWYNGHMNENNKLTGSDWMVFVFMAGAVVGFLSIVAYWCHRFSFLLFSCFLRTPYEHIATWAFLDILGTAITFLLISAMMSRNKNWRKKKTLFLSVVWFFFWLSMFADLFIGGTKREKRVKYL